MFVVMIIIIIVISIIIFLSLNLSPSLLTIMTSPLSGVVMSCFFCSLQMHVAFVDLFAFVIGNSSLEPFLEGLVSQI